MSNTDSARYIEIAQKFADQAAERVDEISEGRRIPADLAGEMADAGLFRLLLPKSLGGVQIDHPSFVEIVRLFALADASTAWCVNQNNIFSTDSARMPKETAMEIWGQPRGIITNGPPSPDTMAVPVNNGYMHSGHWDFSSGSSHATWLAARGPVEGRPGEVRTFLIPKSEARMLDTWHVNGLRGSASFSFEVNNLFVPEAHTYLELNAPNDPGPMYVIPKNALFSTGFATISLALARACLDDAIELASKKMQFLMSTAMIDLSTVQRQIGETESILRSADSYLRDSRLALWNSACERGTLTMDERINVRMSSTYAIREATRVVDSAYELFGSQAIFARNPLQRRYQDMHVIAQQFQGRASNYETAGRYFLGINETATRGL